MSGGVNAWILAELAGGVKHVPVQCRGKDLAYWCLPEGDPDQLRPSFAQSTHLNAVSASSEASFNASGAA